MLFILLLLIFLYVKRAGILAFYARYLMQRGKIKKSLKLFKLADKWGKLSAVNQSVYGFMLLKNGYLDEARTTLSRASMEAKKSDLKNKINMMRALVLWKEGNIDAAIESLENISKTYKTTTLYQDLGLLYVLQKSEKALPFNLEAYDYNSDNLIIKDNLAEAYMLIGDTENAEKLYESIIEEGAHFPEPYYSYGILLINKGEREKGLNLIKESLGKRFSFLSVMTKSDVEALYEKYL